MRLVTLFLIAAFAASTVGAASYQKTDGTIVDPLMDIYGEPHPYSGVNLKSEAWLYGANLTNADLSYADLYRANLTGANLSGVDLSGVDLSGAALPSDFSIINVGKLLFSLPRP